MKRNKGKPPVVLIIGSGFSAEAGLPTTTELADHFLETPSNGVLSYGLEKRITAILKDFWQDVFGFRNGRPPSLEDHFTVIDLAANSGHNLGSKYTPRKLRAIRRMSIHRVLQLLDLKYQHSEATSGLLARLGECFSLSVVSLNWDIVAEKNISQGVNYGIKTRPLDDTFVRPKGVLLLKVHGSSNWVYCDCCRRIYAGTDKSALHRKAFLEVADFELFGDLGKDEAEELRNDRGRTCSHCGNLMAARVATFSYRKALSISQLQTIWDRAHRILSYADTWLFVGYSMPEADFEFRHLLKSAQLGRKQRDRWTCEVVLKDDDRAPGRYMSFLGLEPDRIYQRGLCEWVRERLDSFCRRKKQ